MVPFSLNLCYKEPCDLSGSLGEGGQDSNARRRNCHFGALTLTEKVETGVPNLGVQW